MTTEQSKVEVSKLRDEAGALAGRVAVTSAQVADQEAVESSQRNLIDDVSIVHHTTHLTRQNVFTDATCPNS